MDYGNECKHPAEWRRNMHEVTQIVLAARAEGLSYGQYRVKHPEKVFSAPVPPKKARCKGDGRKHSTPNCAPVLAYAYLNGEMQLHGRYESSKAAAEELGTRRERINTSINHGSMTCGYYFIREGMPLPEVKAAREFPVWQWDAETLGLIARYANAVEAAAALGLPAKTIRANVYGTTETVRKKWIFTRTETPPPPPKPLKRAGTRPSRRRVAMREAETGALIQMFPGCAAAAQWMYEHSDSIVNANSATVRISCCCRSECDTAYGFKWTYESLEDKNAKDK